MAESERQRESNTANDTAVTAAAALANASRDQADMTVVVGAVTKEAVKRSTSKKR